VISWPQSNHSKEVHPIPQMRQVGELARETGLTVRTLHHYDQIGLLSPSRRSASGYRLYGPEDIARLQQIRSLRLLGFPLEDIRTLLDQPNHSPLRVIQLHLSRLREQMALQQTLIERLEALAATVAANEEPQADDIARAIEVMTMTEQVHKYYSPEQLEQLEKRRETVGDERIRQVEAEWPQLIAEMRAEYERGTDPDDQHVQDLARRWQALVAEFTGRDPGIAASLNRMYQNEPDIRQRSGIDPDLMQYVNAALAAGSST
jgi:MerR family transcriptional regulator, thiopeptide resistance regulator